jgi:hypothetical protein
VAELPIAGRVFGPRARDPFASYDLAASAWVARPAEAGERPTVEFCGSWPKAGLVSRRRACPLVDSGHAAQQSPARRWPTPNAKVSNFGERPLSWLKRRERLKKKRYNGNGAGMPLAIAVQIGASWSAASSESALPSARAQLNPAWVEWLMGFPFGWSERRQADQQKGKAA